ncbi:MAG: zf-TFIIB domain-containing protein [Verrucomicrobia bacterium]|nr:zf-TFIIB domain-containing protein [Verrucomicrobiota bacterium]
MPIKPSEAEERYFKTQELQMRMQKLADEQRATAEAEKRRLKELHWMHCPKCGQQLAAEKYGTVEVDLCPTCKGVWLDAYELETIVESAGQSSPFRAFLKILGAR